MNIESKYIAPEEYPRVSWDTKFVTTETEILGWRYINGKPYKLTIGLVSTDTISELFEKYDRLTRIEDSMYILMAEIVTRTRGIEEL